MTMCPVFTRYAISRIFVLQDAFLIFFPYPIGYYEDKYPWRTTGREKNILTIYKGIRRDEEIDDDNHITVDRNLMNDYFVRLILSFKYRLLESFKH